ncbi:hypothetical protein EQG49_00170 [Periweissella cryptocerci]|uniref:SpaA-like prealbumin fold domain-containing protein n=1 Tax=Periweissella cryptocerci TaxID=2506420 RepID=A0A4P6YQT3_9LACO|nr:SpaH/EbpB family LPXTG-anchored major pilin [Periweissella cryptocerci]QBO34969.1 hypothetical protein EQG49_00170 [Periweissella cryptocerci]
MQPKKIAARFLVSAAVLGVFASSTAPIAVPFFGTTTASAASDVRDDTSERSITVHKYQRGTTATTDGETTAGIGNEKGIDGAKPLANVPFVTVKIAPATGKTGSDIDLSKLESGADLAAITAGETAGNYTVVGASTNYTGKTDEDGSYKFELGTGKAADGYYITSELASKSVKAPHAPTLVALPRTIDDKLVYDVQLNPKNDIVNDLSVNKFIENSKLEGAYAGSTKTYTFAANAPAGLSDSINGSIVTAKKFELLDALNANLSYAGNLKFAVGKVSDGDTELSTATPISLNAGTDYTIAAPTGFGGVLKIDFTSAGMTKVANAVATTGEDAKLLTSFDTTVKADSKLTGLIANYLTVDYTNANGVEMDKTTVPGTPTFTQDTPVPDPLYPKTTVTENVPEIALGGFDGVKEDEKSKEPIAGAKFKIAASQADATAGNYLRYKSATDETILTPKDSGYAAGTDIELTSNADGEFSLGGLSVDGKLGTDYFVVETHAPKGYDRISDPVKVHVTIATLDGKVDQEFLDAKQTILPMTGTNLALAGLALVAIVGAGGAFILNKNNKSIDAALDELTD